MKEPIKDKKGEEKEPFERSDTLISLIRLSGCATAFCIFITVFGVALGLSGAICGDFGIAALVFAAILGILLGIWRPTNVRPPFS